MGLYDKYGERQAKVKEVLEFLEERKASLTDAVFRYPAKDKEAPEYLINLVGRVTGLEMAISIIEQRFGDNVILPPIHPAREK